MNKNLFYKTMLIAYKYYHFLHRYYYDDLYQTAWLCALSGAEPEKELYKLAKNNGWKKINGYWFTDLMDWNLYNKFERIIIGGY